MKALVQQGSGIDVYAMIVDEYDTNEYYALNADGNSYWDACDDENYEPEEIEEIQAAWLKCVPDPVRTRFPGIFS